MKHSVENVTGALGIKMQRIRLLTFITFFRGFNSEAVMTKCGFCAQKILCYSEGLCSMYGTSQCTAARSAAATAVNSIFRPIDSRGAAASATREKLQGGNVHPQKRPVLPKPFSE